MLHSKLVVWIVAGLTAVALSATSIFAAPGGPVDNLFGGDNTPGWTKPLVGLLQSSQEQGQTAKGLKEKDKKAGTVVSLEDEETESTETPEPADEDVDDENLGVGEEEIVAALADRFGISEDEIIALRTDEKLGFGEMYKLFRIAESAIEPGGAITTTTSITDALDIILSERSEGKGWGVISKEFNVSVGNKGDNLGAIISGRGITTTTAITDTDTISNTATPWKNKARNTVKNRPSTAGNSKAPGQLKRLNEGN